MAEIGEDFTVEFTARIKVKKEQAKFSISDLYVETGDGSAYKEDNNKNFTFTEQDIKDAMLKVANTIKIKLGE